MVVFDAHAHAEQLSGLYTCKPEVWEPRDQKPEAENQLPYSFGPNRPLITIVRAALDDFRDASGSRLGCFVMRNMTLYYGIHYITGTFQGLFEEPIARVATYDLLLMYFCRLR